MPEIQILYRMSHQMETYSLYVSILNNQQMSHDCKRDLGEDLSHSPHADRRLFMQQLHTLYQQTSCVNQIAQQISTTAYYQHIRQQGYAMTGLMLKHNPKVHRYHYMLFIESEQ